MITVPFLEDYDEEQYPVKKKELQDFLKKYKQYLEKEDLASIAYDCEKVGKNATKLLKRICDNILEIDLLPLLDHVPAYYFANDEQLKSIDIPSNIKYIGNRAFDFCPNLTTVSMQPGVNYIDTYAFADCSKLKNVELPNTLVELREGCFNNCSALEKIFLPDSLYAIRSGAFAGCPDNQVIEYHKGIDRHNPDPDAPSTRTISASKEMKKWLSTHAKPI